MNGDEFYQEFKDALAAVGLRFGNAKEMRVILVKSPSNQLTQVLRFEWGGRAYEVKLDSGYPRT